MMRMLALLAVLPLAITACDFNNMYPTSRTRWACHGDSMEGVVFCQTDNANFTVGLTSGTTTEKNRIRDVVEAQFEPTDLQVSEQRPVVYDGPAETDVVYQIGATVPLGATGVAWCQNAVTSVKCDQHYVRIRSGRVSNGIVCHETGHAVGLTHGDLAAPPIPKVDPLLECMKTPMEWLDGLGWHNRMLIDATY